MQSGKRILCLHAHPDDAEIFVGGTLALLARAGNQVTIATMTAGDCGSVDYDAEEISRIRRGEAARAAAMIGAGYECLGFLDMAIFQTDEARRRVTSALRRHRPDIVITASPADYHCDHEATSRLVVDACFACSAPNYSTDMVDNSAALDAIPHLYFADPVEGVDREGSAVKPSVVVDVGLVFDTKRAMLAAHESQRSWLMKQHGMDDYLATMEDWCRTRGALVGVEYGEGFRQYTGHPWPRTRLLEELLGAGVVRDLA